MNVPAVDDARMVAAFQLQLKMPQHAHQTRALSTSQTLEGVFDVDKTGGGQACRNLNIAVLTLPWQHGGQIPVSAGYNSDEFAVQSVVFEPVHEVVEHSGEGGSMIHRQLIYPSQGSAETCQGGMPNWMDITSLLLESMIDPLETGMIDPLETGDNWLLSQLNWNCLIFRVLISNLGLMKL